MLVARDESKYGTNPFVYLVYYDITNCMEDVYYFITIYSKSLSILKWYPHVWGYNSDKHTTVVQKIMPTAGGLSAVGHEGSIGVHIVDDTY